MEYTDQQIEELVKAVWKAGFNNGYNCGSSNANAYEWGCHGSEPKEAEKAWKQEVQWWIDSEINPMDIKNPKHWENV